MRRKQGAIALGVACACCLAFAAPAAAFDVNDTGTDIDAQSGGPTSDGICDTAVGLPQVCTLRAAVQEANFTVAADTITFSVTGVHSGFYSIANPLTITGNGSGPGGTAIDGGGVDSVIFAQASASPLKLKDLRIQHGFKTIPAASSGGGAGLGTDANTILENVTVAENQVTGAGDGYGAGIGMSTGTATLSLVNSTVSNNIVSATGATFSAGAGIYAANDTTILDSTISGNSITGGSSRTGAGLETPGGIVTITESTISGNTTSGAGIGAGLSIGGNAGMKRIENSTLSGNSAGAGQGGAVRMGGASVFSGVTFADNTATGGGADLLVDFGTTELDNSILGSAGACATSGTGAFSAASINNIDSGASCGLGILGGNQQNTNPLLAPLGAYGGPTLTRALYVGSPAINGAGSLCLATDQRGVGRTTPCDIGAFEGSIALPVPPLGDGTTAQPVTKRKKCKKGFRLKKVKRKRKCVRKKKKK